MLSMTAVVAYNCCMIAAFSIEGSRNSCVLLGDGCEHATHDRV